MLITSRRRAGFVVAMIWVGLSWVELNRERDRSSACPTRVLSGVLWIR
jgi:predicted ABC-type ATPase